MEQFLAFINLGIEHILDLNGLDHLLFVVVLTVAQGYKFWKKTVMLITAFTLGHCLSLILSGLEMININQEIVEFLIPITILITALVNLFLSQKTYGFKLEYSLASFFGLIHGLGFSNYFRAISFGDESILSQLLGFNLGVEIAQLIIVAIIIILEIILIKYLKLNRQLWMKSVSASVALWALAMILL
jgi:hypothetical protein